MTAYSVALTISDVIEADTPEAAEAELRRRVQAAGLEVYEDFRHDTLEVD